MTGKKFKNYIKKAAKNIVVDHLKKQERDEAKTMKLIPVLKELDETIYSSLEDSVIEGEVLSTVHDVLEEFSEKNRKVFISRMFEQKTRKQICEEEKITTYGVKRIEDEILYTLRKKLKHFLN
jgi:RNA polymerase sigma factor (sigma-70 family)